MTALLMHRPGTPDRSEGLPGRTLDRAQQEALRSAVESPALDWKVILVLLTTAVTLTIQEYVFRSGNLDQALDGLNRLGLTSVVEALRRRLVSPQDRQLAGLIFWAGGCAVTYVLIPGLVIKLVFRERLRDYGLRVRGILASSWVYLVLFAAMIGPLLYCSTTAGFQAKYPFYSPAPGEPFWPRLWTWELCYVMQFFALEFFFRGFMIHGTRHRLGFYSIFVMTVPYCMIHYGKPMPETFGAIGAGVILGFMSLKTRSIWLGALLHVAIALSMDFLALWREGLLG